MDHFSARQGEGSGYASEEEESSIEEFGSLSGSFTAGAGGGDGMGSFVNVEKE